MYAPPTFAHTPEPLTAHASVIRLPSAVSLCQVSQRSLDCHPGQRDLAHTSQMHVGALLLNPEQGHFLL